MPLYGCSPVVPQTSAENRKPRGLLVSTPMHRNVNPKIQVVAKWPPSWDRLDHLDGFTVECFSVSTVPNWQKASHKRMMSRPSQTAHQSSVVNKGERGMTVVGVRH